MPVIPTTALLKGWSLRLIYWIEHLIVTLGTLPYYRFFRQNTLLPVLNLAKCVRRGDSDPDLIGILNHWRERKLYELQYIQVASTILAAAVIGCFSWQPISDGFWIGPACWYCALVLSIFAILLSSSQAFIFNALNPPSLQLNSSGDFRRYLALILVALPDRMRSLAEDSGRDSPQDYAIRWKMVFTWQAPMMLMAYAVIFFLAGLTVYVCTPLFKGEATTFGGKVSIFYISIFAFAGATFIFCSFWAYQFIDLDRVAESTSGTAILPMPYPSSSFPIIPRSQSTASNDMAVQKTQRRALILPDETMKEPEEKGKNVKRTEGV